MTDDRTLTPGTKEIPTSNEQCQVCEGLCCGEIPRLNAELARLRETFNCPQLTAEAPAAQFKAVLDLAEKGEPVNHMDLINALWWRVRNQRREIAKLHEKHRSPETCDDLLYRIHRELARGHSSAALAVVAAALEHRPLPVCTACDVVTLNQNAQKALEHRPGCWKLQSPSGQGVCNCGAE